MVLILNRKKWSNETQTIKSETNNLISTTSMPWLVSLISSKINFSLAMNLHYDVSSSKIKLFKWIEDIFKWF